MWRCLISVNLCAVIVSIAVSFKLTYSILSLSYSVTETFHRGLLLLFLAFHIDFSSVFLLNPFISCVTLPVLFSCLHLEHVSYIEFSGISSISLYAVTIGLIIFRGAMFLGGRFMVLLH